MNLEMSLCSLDSLHLWEDWESKKTLPSISLSPHSVHLSLSLWFFVSYTHWHKHIQTFFISLFPFALPLAHYHDPCSSHLLSLHSLSVSLPPSCWFYQWSCSVSYCHFLMWFMSWAVKFTYLLPIHTHTHTYWGAGSHFLGLSHTGSSAAQHPDPARVSRVCCVCVNAGISEEYEGLKWNAVCLVYSQR